MKHYDCVIVGSGMAGFYAALLARSTAASRTTSCRCSAGHQPARFYER